MAMIDLRCQKVSDAKRFFEILDNPNFFYFNVKPKSVEDEKEWLKGSIKRRKKNIEWSYTIIYGKEVVGAIGVKINYHRKHIGEIGYFIDEKYWGKGIASKAVNLVETICFNELKLSRLEILMQLKNKASEKVAIKNGYIKEGIMRKTLKDRNGIMQDCCLYAKVL